MFKNSLNECSAYVTFRMACLFNSIFPENNELGVNRKDLFSASSGLIMLLSIQVNLNKDFYKNITDVNNNDVFRPIAFIDHMILIYAAEIAKLAREKAGDINQICKMAVKTAFKKSKATLMHITLDLISNVVEEIAKKENSEFVLEDLNSESMTPLIDSIIGSDGFDKCDREISQAMAMALFGDLSAIDIGMAVCRVREIQIQALRFYENEIASHMGHVISKDSEFEAITKSDASGTTAYYIAESMKAINTHLDSELAIQDSRIKDFVKSHVYAMFAARFNAFTKYTAVKLIKDMFSIGVIAMRYDLDMAVKCLWPNGMPDAMADVIENIADHVGIRESNCMQVSAQQCSEYVAIGDDQGGFDLKGLLKDKEMPNLTNIMSVDGLVNTKGFVTEAAFDHIIESKANVNITDQQSVIKLCLPFTREFASINAKDESDSAEPVKDKDKKPEKSEEVSGDGFVKNKSRMFN